ncbi:MarR family winged helix-turn-helix transcriptional regulator [Umezawaea tangerina]|uniref:DNA-binding MarR family transcriptional regulator n=1 Tax=Umezawaea tangerina TaxID=84725 RepID=A0A2T0T7F3_9PSEU|nr:helix-turn-helix domain-containing protein [Umezawaea tangerina]PRY41568.1 DNA-binding MarR family transcriptional regulator [Umezawaea tangerina]
MSRPLTDDEMRHWVDWKRATDRVRDDVLREIAESTGLSGADFSVLTRVVESERPPRQQDIADALDWSRSRLSRQLSRMEERDLVVRTTTVAATVVEPTDSGRELARAARRAHAEAVRRALLDRVDSDVATQFWTAVRALGRPPA